MKINCTNNELRAALTNTGLLPKPKFHDCGQCHQEHEVPMVLPAVNDDLMWNIFESACELQSDFCTTWVSHELAIEQNKITLALAVIRAAAALPPPGART